MADQALLLALHLVRSVSMMLVLLDASYFGSHFVQKGCLAKFLLLAQHQEAWKVASCLWPAEIWGCIKTKKPFAEKVSACIYIMFPCAWHASFCEGPSRFPSHDAFWHLGRHGLHSYRSQSICSQSSLCGCTPGIAACCSRKRA